MQTFPKSPFWCGGDNDMITRVIYNLLENATKFAREDDLYLGGHHTIDGKAG